MKYYVARPEDTKQIKKHDLQADCLLFSYRSNEGGRQWRDTMCGNVIFDFLDNRSYSISKTPFRYTLESEKRVSLKDTKRG